MSPISLARLVVLLCFFAQAPLGVSASLSRRKDRSHANSSLGNSYPYCGDCWCVPDNGGTGSCPLWQPVTNFSTQIVQTYLSHIPSSIYTLACNPYVDDACQTTPSQQMVDVDSAVCAYVYAPSSLSSSCTGYSYSMQTFASREVAEQAGPGVVVTHAGACGLCSTAADLAVYLIEDFTTAGKKCATKGLFNEATGLQCYMDLGLTLDCAKIWNYDGIYDGTVCGSTCAPYITAPNNGPPPACELNPCLECDEEYAGPLFSQFAARTRRRSGLMSEIIRNCSSVAQISHDPCSENPYCSCDAMNE